MAFPTSKFAPKAALIVRRSRPISFMRTHSLELFFLLEIACQLALLSSRVGQLRAPIRITVFGSSIAILVLMSGRGKAHPSAGPAKLVLAIVILSLFHPNTNTILAGSAQIGMYVAILAPLFWVARVKVTTAYLRRILVMVWVFQTVSAGVGILQIYYPGDFQPALSIVVLSTGKALQRGIQYRNAFGQITFRAMGLTDVPGGAAYAGLLAALLGTAHLLTMNGLIKRLFAGGTIVVGTSAIFLAQNRSALIVLLICELGIIGVVGVRRSFLLIRPEWRRREAGNLPRLLIAGVLAGMLSITWAISVGGESISSRFATLLADKPTEVYGKNRGHFIQQTIEESLPKYPFGAGLGRWGMMNYYFGDNSNPDTKAIYAEEQWTGWLFDGGIPLILAYVLTIFVAIRTAFRIALSPVEPTLAIFAAVICGYDVGGFASCFGYGYFMSQQGMEYWFLNAIMFAAFVNFQAEMTAEARVPTSHSQVLRRASPSLVRA